MTQLRELYQQYSNVQLLEITLNPAEYRQEAVDIARQILDERQVSEGESESVLQALQQKKEAKSLKETRIQKLKDTFLAYLAPNLHPKGILDLNLWLNICLIWLCFQSVTLLYHGYIETGAAINSAPPNLKYSFSFWFYSVSYHWIGLIYTIFLIYLLFKRKKWGWILFFIRTFMFVFGSIWSAFITWNQWDLQSSGVTWLIPIILQTVLLFFLWKEEVASLFSVEKSTKYKLMPSVFLMWFVGMLLLKQFAN